MSPAVDVAYAARDAQALGAAFGVQVPADVEVAVPIWTTTPWTLPASLAVSLGPELDYALVEGPAHEGRRRWLVLADALAERALQRYGVAGVSVHGRARGAALENLLLAHPFYRERDIPLILGAHVSAEDGTGAVHTAPGHGQDDYVVGKAYGLLDRYSAAQLNPVDGRGVYLPSTPAAAGVELAGQHIWKANDAIVEVLRASGALLAFSRLEHSYPHCWRHKTPIAFRATPQWFISMEQANLRADALAAIDTVKWYPEWGKARIAASLASAPELVRNTRWAKREACTSSCARRIGGSLRKALEVCHSLPACSTRAACRSGSLWPRPHTAMPAAQSTYSRPWLSHRREPAPRSSTIWRGR